MTKKKKWGSMSPDEREEAVRALMNEGGSNKSVAGDLDTTPGTIAGFRRRKGIRSTHDAPGMGKTKKKKAKPAPKPKEAAPQESEVPGLVESKSEASRCEYKRERCEYEAKPGTNFCPLHQQDPARH